MKILITGSSGTVGTRLCEKLIEQEHEIIGADWHPNKWKPEINKFTVNIDLRDPEGLSGLPKDIDLICHLAANARVYELVKEPDMAMDNFLTTYNMLEFARRHSIKRFIFTSSRETYGNDGHETHTEDLVRIDNCESPYTASKIGGEALVWSYARCYGIDGIVARLSNVYGMYDDSDRVVPLFIRQAKSGEPMRVYGKDKYLDFTYIDDTVNGLCLALEKFDSAKNETYNLAYGKGTSLIRLAESVRKLIGSASDIRISDNRPGEVVKYVADISKAKERLGYEPMVDFEEGIKKTVKWYETNLF